MRIRAIVAAASAAALIATSGCALQPTGCSEFADAYDAWVDSGAAASTDGRESTHDSTFQNAIWSLDEARELRPLVDEVEQALIALDRWSDDATDDELQDVVDAADAVIEACG